MVVIVVHENMCSRMLVHTHMGRCMYNNVGAQDGLHRAGSSNKASKS